MMLHGGAVSPSDLAEQMEVSLPTISKSLSGLERRGWIERTADIDDRRRVLLGMTRVGRKKMRESFDAGIAQLEAALSSASPEELERIEAGLDSLHAVFHCDAGASPQEPALPPAGERERPQPMIKLLLKYLKPYWKQLTLVMVLLLLQAIANLYLPELNADIINNGVAKGDTAYIMPRRWMLLVTGLRHRSIVSVYWGSYGMAFGATSATRSSAGSRASRSPS